jgi:hypothetical protein
MLWKSGVLALVAAVAVGVGLPATAARVTVTGEARGAGLQDHGARAGEGTIVFASDRSGGQALYALDAPSGSVSRLAPSQADHPVAAPTGNALAYQTFGSGGFGVELEAG